jgi:hypothetical protein
VPSVHITAKAMAVLNHHVALVLGLKCIDDGVVNRDSQIFVSKPRELFRL